MTHKEPVKKTARPGSTPDIGLPKPQLAQLPLGKTEFLIHLQKLFPPGAKHNQSE